MLPPRDFVRDYLRGKIGVREVVVGHSVSFGHNRAGNAAVMVELGRELGFDTDVVGAGENRRHRSQFNQGARG